MNESVSKKALISEQARAWILPLDSGELEADDALALDAWLDADIEHWRTFDVCRRIWNGMAASPELASMASSDGRREAVPRMVRPRSVMGLKSAIARRPFVAVMSLVAASVAVVLVAPHLILSMRADYRAGNQVTALTLHDGSRAILDAGAALAVDFGTDRRTIRLLAGNAFFDVRHGDQRPFRVELPNGTAEDLCTRFELRSRSSAPPASICVPSITSSKPH